MSEMRKLIESVKRLNESAPMDYANYSSDVANKIAEFLPHIEEFKDEWELWRHPDTDTDSSDETVLADAAVRDIVYLLNELIDELSNVDFTAESNEQLNDWDDYDANDAAADEYADWEANEVIPHAQEVFREEYVMQDEIYVSNDEDFDEAVWDMVVEKEPDIASTDMDKADFAVTKEVAAKLANIDHMKNDPAKVASYMLKNLTRFSDWFDEYGDDIRAEVADAEEERRDPYGYRGLSKSDFY